MATFEENVGRIARSMGAAAGQTAPASPFYLGEVKQAGGGSLRVSCGGLELGRGDLFVSAQLRWDWTWDDGSPQLLRPGDRVVLLSRDGQDFYLIARMVRV